jgi:hypothetical protein
MRQTAPPTHRKSRVDQAQRIHQQAVIRWVQKSEGVLMIPDSEDSILTAKGMIRKAGLLEKLLKARHADRLKEEKRA